MQRAKLLVAGLIGAAVSFFLTNALSTRAPAAEESSHERRAAELFSGLYSAQAPNGKTYWFNDREARDCYCNWATWTYGGGRELILECGVLRTSPMAGREKIDVQVVDDQVMDISTRLIMSQDAARQVSHTLSSAVAATDKWN